MKNIIHYFLRRIQIKKPIASHKSLKVHPFEVKFDKKTNQPYINITPISKFKAHKYFLEDLIEDNVLLNKLEFESVKYIFYSYGILRATEKNNLYCLEEILLLNNEIKVKNLTTFDYEYWNKQKFDTNFMLLDKKSLKLSCEFFSNIKPNSSNGDNGTDEDSKNNHLKLIK